MAIKKRIFKPRSIDIDNFTDRRNSAMSLGVTEDMLRAAINEVGAVYEDVRRYLKSYRTPYFHRKSRGLN